MQGSRLLLRGGLGPIQTTTCWAMVTNQVSIYKMGGISTDVMHLGQWCLRARLNFTLKRCHDNDWSVVYARYNKAVPDRII